MRIVLAFLISPPGSSEAKATSEKAASHFHVRHLADIPADETADRTSLQPVSSAEHSALISWSLTLEQPSGQIRMRQCAQMEHLVGIQIIEQPRDLVRGDARLLQG